MVLMAVLGPYGQRDHSTKGGGTDTDKPRYRCHHPNCPHQSFLLPPAYKGRLPESKAPMIALALTSSGIRDTAGVLGLRTDTVLNEGTKKLHHCARSISPC